MAVPWLQIVRLVPSILDVSRELLKRTKRMPAASGGELPAAPAEDLTARVVALEENEQRQAELVNQMAEQNAVLARAVTSLHGRLIRLGIAAGVATLIAIVALVLAVSR